MSTGRQEAQTRERLASILQSVHALTQNKPIGMISDVTDQHMKLLQKYDGFVGAILYGHLESREIDELAQDFLNNLRIHFAVEETLMAIIEYGDMAAHQRRHRLFLEGVGQIMPQVLLGTKCNGDLAILIGDWLLEHESMTDGHLTKYVIQVC